jgi:hypothetical protein
MRKVLALILIILIVFPLLLVTLMTFSVSTWILNRSFYLGLVSSDQLYEALVESVRNEAGPPADLHSAGAAFDYIPTEALVRALAEVASPRYLSSEAKRMVNEFFDGVQSGEPTLQLYVDLVPLKDSLRGQGASRFADTLAANLPVCAQGEGPTTAGSTVPRCRPSSLTRQELATRILAGLPAFVDSLPDHYTVYRETVRFERTPAERFWIGFVGTYRLVWANIVLALLAGAFWIGAAFVAGTSRHDIVQWLGWSLFAPAALTLILGIGVRVAAGFPWLEESLRPLFGPDLWYHQEVVETVRALAQGALRTVAKGFLTAGGASLGASVGLVIWAHSIPVEEP